MRISDWSSDVCSSDLSLERLGRLPTALFPPERKARRWSMVLQAYDGMRAGASQREIATTIFGEEHVCDYREAGYLSTRVQRLIRTAEKIIAGGYHVLLQSAEAALKAQHFRGDGTSRSAH